jgi:hypothetical protein
VVGSAVVAIESNSSGLERLAFLLRFRYRASRRRSFVMLEAHPRWARFPNTDQQETQRIPLMPTM